jgi:hypothetical protein
MSCDRSESISDRLIMKGWAWLRRESLDRISGSHRLRGFDLGFWSAAVARFGVGAWRDVEVGLVELVPPSWVKRIFLLSCKVVHWREIKGLRSSVMGDESRVISFGEIIFGVKIVNGRTCDGSFGWGRGLELVIAGTCEAIFTGECAEGER